MEKKEVILKNNKSNQDTILAFDDFVEQEKGVYMGDGCGSVDFCDC